MSKKKLDRFEENRRLKTLFQPSRDEAIKLSAMKGRWCKIFKNDNPIIIELGCGKGEYTINLARRFRDKNFIGIDIKGARIWKGAKIAQEENINNAFFIRTNVELIANFFYRGEVEEIWITFPDPYIKRRAAKKRLTSNNFLKLYKNILVKNGKIHLKTDNYFLYGYTLGCIESQNYKIHLQHHDIYNNNQEEFRIIKEIKTYYENKFLSKKLPISYIQFSLD